MNQAIQKYLEYLRSVRNSSPHTVLNYGKDLEQFSAYLSPPGVTTPTLGEITHQIIREYVGHLHSQKLEKSSIARKLAALRSFFKYCVREGWLKENPARLVPTPKLPKRIPSVLSAEEMNGFLNQLAVDSVPSAAKHPPGAKKVRVQTRVRDRFSEPLLLRRDRALLELLYAAGLRVSELTGLNLADMDRSEKMLRVRGKGNKERRVPIGLECRRHLFRWLNAHSFDLVFCTRDGSKLRYDKLRSDFLALLDTLKIPKSEGCFHAFRRYFGKSYLRGGGNPIYLQRVFGHTTLDMTKRYVEADDEDLQIAHRALSPLDQIKRSKR